MLSNEKIAEIIERCKGKGLIVRVRDIAYVVLCSVFEDNEVAYKTLFGEYDSVDNYDNKDEIIELKKIIKSVTTKTHEDITFEENKAYMLKLKKDTEAAMAVGEIDKKDGLKILADLSVKLNDKFSVNEEVKDQMVVVNTKYNTVCPYCRHETYIPTKEDLIKEYNLKEA